MKADTLRATARTFREGAQRAIAAGDLEVALRALRCAEWADEQAADAEIEAEAQQAREVDHA